MVLDIGLSISVGYHALALLTYETAHANGTRLEIKNSHEVMKQLIDKDFGELIEGRKVRSLIDNKITACYSNSESMLFITYWDSVIYIGPEAVVMTDWRMGMFYRCQPPRSFNMDSIEASSNLLLHWEAKFQ